jgi:DNA-binding NtrC family response regulator
MATILYVDDEPAIGLILEDTLERAGHTAIGAHSVPQALQALTRGGVDLVISDYRMPGLTGLEFLQLLQQEGYDVPLIMLTGYATIEHAVASIKAGAIDYITKPVRPEQLELAVNQALEFVRLRRENETLRREVMEFRNERQIIGDSQMIRRLMQTVNTAAPTRATVLLQGESGTGKELFARAIHDASDRRDKPFIKLNCAALPEGLIESALFGHEKGAFTGAIKRVEGAFERAHTGTLLLDEISEMRLDLQAKLLRVLQEQEFERVGGSSPIKVDVRIIATTSPNSPRSDTSGRTCTSGSASSRSPSRPCAIGRRTSPSSPPGSPCVSRPRWERTSREWHRRRSPCSRRTHGPATCASCSTRSSGPSSSRPSRCCFPTPSMGSASA